MLDRENIIKNKLQKLDETDLEKVSGGTTKIENVDFTIKINKISTTCDNCGTKRTLEIDENDYMYYNSESGGRIYSGMKFWKCKNCGKTNDTGYTGISAGIWEGGTDITGTHKPT